MIEARRRITHIQDMLGPDGYARIIPKHGGVRPEPSRAPEVFAVTIGDLEDA